MTREQTNKKWVAAFKNAGISTIELDCINDTVKFKIHDLYLYKQFTKNIENFVKSTDDLVSQSYRFDLRLNINLIGLWVQSVSDITIPSDIFIQNPRKAIKFEDNTAVVDLQAGIMNVEVTEIEGSVIDENYWIK